MQRQVHGHGKSRGCRVAGHCVHGNGNLIIAITNYWQGVVADWFYYSTAL